MADEFLSEEMAVEKVDPVVEEQTFRELPVLSKVEVLMEKYESYPEYQKMDDSEKINILITEHAEQLKEAAVQEQQARFFSAKATAMKERAAYEEKTMETLRVKLYKERLALQQTWNDAAVTGDWKAPE